MDESQFKKLDVVDRVILSFRQEYPDYFHQEVLTCMDDSDQDTIDRIHQILDNASAGMPDDAFWSRFQNYFLKFLIDYAEVELIWNDLVEEESLYAVNELYAYQDKIFIWTLEGKIHYIYEDKEKALAEFMEFYRDHYNEVMSHVDGRRYGEEVNEEEDDEEEEDKRPAGYFFLPFFNPYLPFRGACRVCSHEFVLNGYRSLLTNLGEIIQHEYQCQGCGAFRFAGGELPPTEGVRAALAEPCDCGGQFRRDKNIFCPSCGYRKQPDNRAEEYLAIPQATFDALRERHGKPMEG
ncbi:MAG: hypothetical protein RLY31_2887 [Bacteroidota bacterium]